MWKWPCHFWLQPVIQLAWDENRNVFMHQNNCRRGLLAALCPGSASHQAPGLRYGHLETICTEVRISNFPAWTLCTKQIELLNSIFGTLASRQLTAPSYIIYFYCNKWSRLLDTRSQSHLVSPINPLHKMSQQYLMELTGTPAAFTNVTIKNANTSSQQSEFSNLMVTKYKHMEIQGTTSKGAFYFLSFLALPSLPFQSISSKKKKIPPD